jgi:hypothetical protein
MIRIVGVIIFTVVIAARWRRSWGYRNVLIELRKTLLHSLIDNLPATPALVGGDAIHVVKEDRGRWQNVSAREVSVNIWDCEQTNRRHQVLQRDATGWHWICLDSGNVDRIQGKVGGLEIASFVTMSEFCPTVPHTLRKAMCPLPNIACISLRSNSPFSMALMLRLSNSGVGSYKWRRSWTTTAMYYGKI